MLSPLTTDPLVVLAGVLWALALVVLARVVEKRVALCELVGERGVRVWPLGERATTALVCVAAIAAHWTLAASTRLWDRDEPRFARAAVEMLASGDYLVPTFNGVLRPDKPPLVYWLMTLTLRLGGESEWAVRAGSALGIAATALLVSWLGRRLLGAGVGPLAALVFVLSPLVFGVGSLATTDALLLALIWLALTLLTLPLLALPASPRRLWLVPALGAVLGLAQLAKGPVGLAVPLLGWGVWRGWARRRRTEIGVLEGGAVVAAALLGVALFLLWALPANLATGGELARRGLGHHVVGRMLTPLESHGAGWLGSLAYYPAVVVFLFLPWTLFLPGAIAALVRGRLGDERARGFLLGAALPVLVLMTLVATKLPHYALPAFPALALGVAAVVRAARTGRLDARSRMWLERGSWLFAPAAGLTAAVLLAGAWSVPLPALRPHLLALGAAWSALAWVGLRLHRRRAYLAAVLALAIGMAGFYFFLGFALARADDFQLARPLAMLVRAHAEARAPVAAVGFQEPSLAFYLGCGFEELGAAGLVGWAAEPGSRVLLVDGEDLDPSSTALLAEQGFVELGRRSGFNFAKGRQVEVAVWLRSSAGESFQRR